MCDWQDRPDGEVQGEYFANGEELRNHTGCQRQDHEGRSLAGESGWQDTANHDNNHNGAPGPGPDNNDNDNNDNGATTDPMHRGVVHAHFSRTRYL